MSESNAHSTVAVILAAGQGTRMKTDLPKVLCEAGKRPLVKHVIDALRAGGVKRLIAVVGYRAELVEAALADEPELRFAYQTERRGTGHAVMMCRELLQDHRGPVVVVAGDSPMLQAASIERLLAEFRESGAACVLGTLIHERPAGLGRIVRDEAGVFLRIVEEKDATDQEKAIREVNMSTYVFDGPALLRSLDRLTDDNQQQEYYITDLPQILLEEGAIVQALPVLQPIESLSVNTVEQLAEVERELERLEKR